MVAELGVKVLIADGSPVIRRALFTKLLELDVFSDTVSTGKEALEKLSERPYAVMLLDLALPGIEPELLLEAITNLPGKARPVVIVFATSEAARKLDVELVQIVMRQPIDIQQTAEIVQSCVRTVAIKRAPKDGDLPDGDHLTS
ncbi:MAG TPA: response regulator [Thermoanaerobaculia bacterium]